MIDALQTAGWWAAWLAVWLLCTVGLALSCLSISGTWLVTAAAAGAAWLRPDAFPGWGTVGAFAAVSTAVELAEWGAGAWGVTRRGGSRWAGAAAVAGGLLGMVAGTILLPMPIVGSLAGMIAGSFAAAFAVEQYRLQHAGHAATIAWGAVTARIAILLAKVATTLAMIATLATGIVSS